MRQRQQPRDLLKVRNLEGGIAGLTSPKQFSAAAQPQVLFRQPEPVLRLAHQRQTFAPGLRQRLAAQQQAGRLLTPPPDAPAQLVQLR